MTSLTLILRMISWSPELSKFSDDLCPYRTIQYRADCKTWLSDDTKEKMTIRDETRELARTSNDPDTWKLYRSRRNEVNRQVNSDRKKHHDDIYERHHLNNDVGATYRTAKNQVGWSKNMSPISFIHEGKKITDPQAMADLQMNVFTEKTDKTHQRTPTSHHGSLQNSL